MKAQVLGLALALSLCQLAVCQAYIPSHPSAVSPQQVAPPTIRVLIAHDVPKARLDVQGGFSLVNPLDGREVGRRLDGKSRQIEALPSGIKWGEEFLIYQLQVVPTASDSLITVNGIPYRGLVTFYDIGGSLSAVNELTIEQFVAGQIGNQDGQLPEEAMAALAIAARTQAYFQAAHPRNKFWDVNASAVNYAGESVPNIAAGRQAVQSTRFMVLTDSGRDADSNSIAPIQWSLDGKGEKGARLLLVSDAVRQAETGADAAQILERTFPGTALQRVYQNP